MKVTKAKDHLFYVINVKLRKHGKRTAGIEDYRKLFLDVYKNKVHKPSSPGKHCIFKIMVGHKNYVSGLLVQFTYIEGKKWLDLNRLEEDGVEIDLPKDIFPDPVETEYIFVPEAHRFAFRTTTNISMSPNSIMKFLELALNEVKDKNDIIQVNIEVTHESIERILKAYKVKKVSLKLNYSNFDFGGDVENMLDEDMNNTSVEDLIMEVKSKKAEGLKLANSKIIRGFINLCKSNGEAEARIINEDGKKEIIKTTDHPEKIRVHSDASSLNERTYNAIINHWRPNAKSK